jgi:hypothetical protein
MTMKKSNYYFITFFITYLFYIYYILYINKGFKIDIIYFWIAIVIQGILVYLQISLVEKDQINERLVLFEISLIAIGINLVYIATHNGLYGHDPHWDLAVTENIINYGWPLTENIMEKIRSLSEWPILHISTIMIKEITNSDIMQIARYLPIVFSTLSLIYFYSISIKCYCDKKTALLASFIFAVLCWHTAYHSKYIRETLAFMFFYAILYIILNRQNFQFKIVLIIFTIALAFTHHLTSLMLILFLAIVAVLKIVISYIIESQLFKKYKKEFYVNKLLMTTRGTLIFIITCIISYWLYVGDFTFNFLKIAHDDLLMGIYGTYSINSYAISGSIRMISGFYGNVLFMLLFIVILLLRILRNKKENNLHDVIFMVYGAIIIFISYISASLVPRIEYSRFIIFGFALLLISFANIAIRSNMFYRIIFFVFFIFQIFLINPYMYNHNYQPEYEHGNYREYYSAEEYKAVDWFMKNVTKPNRVAGDWTVYEILGSKQINVDYTSKEITDIFEGYLKNIKNFDWLVLREEDFHSARINQARITASKQVSEDTYNSIEENDNLQKVYINAEITYYQIKN